MHSALLKSLLPIFSAATLLLLAPAILHAQQQTALIPDIYPAMPSVPAVSHAPQPAATRPSLIVIGFAGGFIRRTSTFHGEIALAHDLSKKYGDRIQSEIFENHHGEEAHREILRLVHLSDPTAAGPEELSSVTAGATSAPISPSDATQPRVILYGHSWGASEAVAVARELQRDGIPVLLLVAVDSVRKRQQDDSIIPANVAQAINFYQTDGLLHGRPVISAADPASTQILDNIHLTYKDNPVTPSGYSWFTRTFTKRHIQIENDPRVWNQVEAMITAKLPPA